MSETQHLAPEEVSERCRGDIGVETLRNWWSMRIGRSFVKVGKGVLYPVGERDAWNRKNVVQCRASR